MWACKALSLFLYQKYDYEFQKKVLTVKTNVLGITIFYSHEQDSMYLPILSLSVFMIEHGI